jgi:hypothetical protein
MAVYKPHRTLIKALGLYNHTTGTEALIMILRNGYKHHLAYNTHHAFVF